MLKFRTHTNGSDEDLDGEIIDLHRAYTVLVEAFVRTHTSVEPLADLADVDLSEER